MAARSPSSSASDGAEKKKKSSPSKTKKPEPEVEDSEPGQQSGEEQEQEESGGEEFEIEAILDAKKGQFGKNKMGYFVKWVGYGPEHNSWVDEDDAGNATVLIKEYNERLAAEKKKSPKKPLETKRSRKSMGDDASEQDDSVAKKRGRKSTSEKPADKDDDERPAKKPRKTTVEKKPAPAPAPAASEPPPDEEVGTMEQHMQAPTWDQLIKKIDTVERVDDTLFVYFTLLGGERIREDSKICADKFPKMLIDFYEANLRWKESN
ncbi:hypothetical protein C8R45DRAFT_997222 [Mycena sanguinolenta]|nr:hypothetical protein C8R45DRAFT_997222 [Mycena sanguinolenta]